MGQYPSAYEINTKGKWSSSEKHIYFIIGKYFGRINTNKKTLHICHYQPKYEYYLWMNAVRHFKSSINDIIIAYNVNKSSKDFKKTMTRFFEINSHTQLEETVIPDKNIP